MSKLAPFAAVLALAAVAGPPAVAATPASVPQAAPFVNGQAVGTLVDGDTLYVTGTFDTVGTAAGPLALVGSADGVVRRTFRGITGNGYPTTEESSSLVIRALVPDGAGGWYAGGSFSQVDGMFRQSLVHLLADGSLDRGFRADVVGPVKSLALRGNTLYVAGQLASVSGEAADDVAAVDARTGARLPWKLDVSFDYVDTLELSGDRLYVGGAGVSVFNPDTGRRIRWAPHVRGEVEDIAVRDGIVYLAGRFERAQDVEAYGAAAVRADDASLVQAGYQGVRTPNGVVATDAAVIWSGPLDGYTGLKASDPVTGRDLGWFAGVQRYRDGAIAVDGNRLFASDIVGAPGGLAAYDLRDGSPVDWNPGLAGGVVYSLAAAGGEVAIGGTPGALGAVARRGLAAFDLRTGAVLPFDAKLATKPKFPSADLVRPIALAKAGGVLYVGGRFDTAGGQDHLNLVALDPVTGAPSAFPADTAEVHELAVSGSTLFVGGKAGKLGEQAHTGLAAVDLASGAPLTWAPKLDCDVDALAVSGSVLDVGGCFTQVGGAAQRGLAAFRLSDLATVPSPRVDGRVWALLADGAGGAWVGGAFSTLGGVAAANVGHLGSAGGVVPRTDGPVYALSTDGSVLNVGGTFTKLQDVPRFNVGQVSLADGAVTSFDPEPAGGVGQIVPLGDGSLLAGGGYMWSALGAGGGLQRFSPGPAVAAPAPVAAPRITGDSFVGGTQRTDGGEWDAPALQREIRWLRCDGSGNGCVDTGSKSSSGIDLRDADAGHRFRVEVRVSNDGGWSVVSRSAPGPQVAGYRPEYHSNGYPMIWGIRRPGQTLTADPGYTEPAATRWTYDWKRCDDDFCEHLDVDAPSITLTDDDAGKRIYVSVTAANDAGADTKSSINEEVEILPGPPNGTRPSGATPQPPWQSKAGYQSIASAEDIDPEGHTYRYTWLSCDAGGDNCVRLPGHSIVRRNSAADIGHRLRVAVVTYDADGESPERFSDPGPVIVPDPDATPTPTPTATPSPTPTATPSPTPTATPSPTPAATSSPTATPTATPDDGPPPKLPPLDPDDPVETAAAFSPAPAVAIAPRRRGVAVRVLSPVAARVTVDVRLANRSTLLGHAAGSVRAGVARTLTVKLTKRGRALLHRAARAVVLELRTPSGTVKQRTRLRV